MVTTTFVRAYFDKSGFIRSDLSKNLKSFSDETCGYLEKMLPMFFEAENLSQAKELIQQQRQLFQFGYSVDHHGPSNIEIRGVLKTWIRQCDTAINHGTS